MRKFLLILPVAGVFALICSCGKQQTEAERNTEVERQVQERLAAEHQTEEQQRLNQTQADLDQRVKDLENRGANTTPATTVATSNLETEAEPQGGEATRSARGGRTRVDQDDREPGNYSVFYTRLEPQGSWLETSNYGYVWQPHVPEQSRSWRPYTNGRWVYTDVGWTWISEEPFGWATYHYGRWTRLRNVGWVWVPGDEWAPAWVSWRKGGDYVGWAPLPPEARFEHGSGIHNWADNYYDIGPDQYAFVSATDFGNERIDRAVVPSDRNVTIVEQTTNVTNITYNNTTVINGGPSFEEIRSHTRRPVEQLHLQRETTVNFGTNEPRAVVRGQTVDIPAPVIPRGQAGDRPHNLKQNLPQAEVDHGWENIGDRQAAERVRIKIKGEATPPANAPSRTFVKPSQTQAATTPATARTPAGAQSAATAAPAPTALATAAPGATIPTRHFSPGTRAQTSPTASPAESRGAAAETPTDASTATPLSTATVHPASTGSATPVNTATPLRPPRSTPAATAIPPTPVPSESAPAGQSGRGNARQERRAERQEQRQQDLAPAASPRTSATTPNSTVQPAAPAAATPEIPSSPAASRKELRKEERRARRAGEPAETPTPSP